MKLRNFSLIPAALSAAMVVMLVCGCSQTPPTGTLLLDYDPSSHNYGYIDSVGNVILPYKYVEAYEFDGSHAIVFSSEANAYSVIDKNGKEVLENLTSIGDFVNGFAKVTMDFTKVGIVNRQYEAVVPIGKYQRLDVPHSGIIRAWVETDHYFSDGYYVFLDTLGNELFHNKYDGIFEYSDSMLLVKSQGGYGFIDTEGREVIPCRYSRAEDFHEGRAAVRFNPSKFNQWGIIDKTGRTIVGPTYSEIKPFSDGLAAVCDGDNFGYNTPRFSDRHTDGGMKKKRYLCGKEENQNGKTIEIHSSIQGQGGRGSTQGNRTAGVAGQKAWRGTLENHGMEERAA